MEAVSQHKCTFCDKPLETFRSRHVCEQCGRPQPVRAGEDYFVALGVPRRFSQDRSLLEKRFYELSRILHPDRFTTEGSEMKSLSLDRMSFLNQAYRTLKSSALLREYLLQLEGIAMPQGSSKLAPKTMPMELAEAWFEIQDALMEDPTGAAQKLSEFKGQLAQHKQSLENQIVSLEQTYDTNPSRSHLENMVQVLQTQSYLNSMEKDVERMSKNADSN